MKRAFLLLALLATTTFGAVPAPYPLAVDSQSANAPMLQLYRASPRTIRVQFTDGGTAADLTGLTTNDLHLTWATSNAAPAFVASDVAIYNATNGQADFAFTSGDLNYAQGRYIYEAAAGSTVVKQGVLVILGSPFATGTNSPAWTTNVNLSGYTFSNYPWLTDAPSDGTIYGRQDAGWVAVAGGGGSGTLTNILRGAGSSARLSVSNGAGPQVTLNLDASGLATGAPVYVESDPIWAAASNSIGQRVTSNTAAIAANAAIMATGQPVYVESDPIWVGASNLYYTKVLADARFATGTPLYVVTSNTLSGVDGSGLTNLPTGASGVQYQDTRGFTNTGSISLSDAGGELSIGTGSGRMRYRNGSITVEDYRTFNLDGGEVDGDWRIGGSLVDGLERSGIVNLYVTNVFHGTNNVLVMGRVTAVALQGVDGSGLTNLPASGGAPQSPWTNTHDGAENVLTAAHLRVRSLLVGEGNSLGTGSNNVSLVGGASFGSVSRGNVSAGQAATFANSVQNSFVWGTNAQAAASYAIAGGRGGIAVANYGVALGGWMARAEGTAAAIVGGFGPTNIGDYGFVGGGYNNRGGAAYTTVAGGATNWALAIGSTIPGGGKMTIASTGDWSVAMNLAPTNAQTFGTKQASFINAPGGVWTRAPSYAGNAGRNTLTSGVCMVTLPFPMENATYSIQLTYATDATLLTPLSATGTTTAIYVLGSGNNPFHWNVVGVAP